MKFFIVLLLFYNLLLSNGLDCDYNERKTIDYLHEMYIYQPGNFGDSCVNTYSYTSYLKNKRTVKTQNNAIWTKNENKDCFCKDKISKEAMWDKVFTSSGNIRAKTFLSNKVFKNNKIKNKNKKIKSNITIIEKIYQEEDKELFEKNKLTILEKDDIKLLDNNYLETDNKIPKFKSLDKIRKLESMYNTNDNIIVAPKKRLDFNIIKKDKSKNTNEINFISSKQKTTKGKKIISKTQQKSNLISEEDLFKENTPNPKIKMKKRIKENNNNYNQHQNLFKNTNYSNVFENKRKITKSNNQYKPRLKIVKNKKTKKVRKKILKKDKIIVTNHKYIFKKYLKPGKYFLKLSFSSDIDIIRIYSEDMLELYNIPIFNKNLSKISFKITIAKEDYYTFAALNNLGKGFKGGLKIIELKEINRR